MNQPTQTWLTQEAADRLKAELTDLEKLQVVILMFIQKNHRWVVLSSELKLVKLLITPRQMVSKLQ